MLTKIWKFIKHYHLFFIALAGAISAAVLDLAGLERWSQIVMIVVIAGELLPLLWGMVRDVQSGTYGVDILAATAIIVSVIMQEYWAGMVIVLMLTGGESLEDYAEHRASKELDALLHRAPQKARILRGNQEIEIPAREVKEDDIVIIRPGEVVAVDALVIEGTSDFNESSLTGESLPVTKTVGQSIMSGSVTLEGLIKAKAIHTAADSQYQQIIKLVRAANQTKAPFVRLADRYAVPFTIISFGIAGIAWALSGDSLRFLQVLVVATPCPLILAAPIAIISGMSRAAKEGIIIKNGSALEQLAAAQTFAFDKTGTLTSGIVSVDTVATFNNFSRDEVISIAAALEKNSNHVLATAVVSKAAKLAIKVPRIKNITEVAGKGLQARVNGKTVLVGRLSFLEDSSVTLPKSVQEKTIQQTAAYVAIGGVLAGIITFQDEVRPEAKKTLQRLRSLGVRTIIMVTGDNNAVAKTVAKKVGIKQFFANALPGDKIHAVQKAHDQPVAFIGDGVNDAPVLTASNVGIALGARGSTAASESADVVIMLDDLRHVADSREIARRTFYIAKQSIVIGIGLSVVLMLIFATGSFKPIYGAAIQEVVDIIVIFNALRAHGSGRNALTGRLSAPKRLPAA